MRDFLILFFGTIIGIFICFYSLVEVSITQQNRQITCLELGIEKEKCKQIFSEE